MSTTKTSAQVPKLRFPGFEGEWPRQPLDAITSKKISYGIVQAGEHVPGGMPYIKSQDLNQPLDLDSLQRTSAEIARKYQRSEVEPGDIVFSLRGNIGVCQIVPASIPAANLTQGTARIAVADHDNRLVAQILQTLDVVRQIEACAKGSTFREISLQALRKITVAISPTLPEQQKIAAFLTAVDGRIEQLSRKKALLEEYKKSVMQQLFTQTLRFQDDHGHDFPDWEEKTLGSVATLINGRAYKQNELLSEGPYPVLRVGNFFSNPEWYYSDLELPQDKYCDTGDLLYAWSASFGPRIWKGGKVIYHYHIWKVLPSTKVDKNYLFHFMDWDTERIKRAQSSGAVMLHVTKQSMEERPMPVPSLPEQTKIASFLSALDGKIAAVGEQMRQTQAWKKGLLQQMFV